MEINISNFVIGWINEVNNKCSFFLKAFELVTVFNLKIWDEAKMLTAHCSVSLISELEICTLFQKWMPSASKNLDFFLFGRAYNRNRGTLLRSIRSILETDGHSAPT